MVTGGLVPLLTICYIQTSPSCLCLTTLIKLLSCFITGCKYLGYFSLDHSIYSEQIFINCCSKDIPPHHIYQFRSWKKKYLILQVELELEYNLNLVLVELCILYNNMDICICIYIFQDICSISVLFYSLYLI